MGIEENANNKKRVRDDSDESQLDSSEVKRIKENLLDDDSVTDPVSQDLDSVMRSFQEEILASPSSAPAFVDLTSDSGESQPELGYLLEASDDELGLPPSSINSERKGDVDELVRVDSVDSVGIGEFWGFENELTGYDSFEFGVVDDYSSDYVAFDDTLFEHSNVWL